MIWLMMYLSINVDFAEGRLYAVDRETLIIRQYTPYRSIIRISKSPTVKLYNQDEITFFEAKQLTRSCASGFNLVWAEIYYEKTVTKVYVFVTSKQTMEEHLGRKSR